MSRAKIQRTSWEIRIARVTAAATRHALAAESGRDATLPPEPAELPDTDRPAGEVVKRGRGAADGAAMSETRCECGAWSGEACAWHGSKAEMVSVEYMPHHLRDGHANAGSRGRYPHNGSRRILVSATCAAAMISDDGEWCEVVQ